MCGSKIADTNRKSSLGTKLASFRLPFPDYLKAPLSLNWGFLHISGCLMVYKVGILASLADVCFFSNKCRHGPGKLSPTPIARYLSHDPGRTMFCANYRCCTPTHPPKTRALSHRKGSARRWVSQFFFGGIMIQGASHETVAPIALQWPTTEKLLSRERSGECSRVSFFWCCSPTSTDRDRGREKARAQIWKRDEEERHRERERERKKNYLEELGVEKLTLSNLAKYRDCIEGGISK